MKYCYNWSRGFRDEVVWKCQYGIDTTDFPYPICSPSLKLVAVVLSGPWQPCKFFISDVKVSNQNVLIIQHWNHHLHQHLKYCISACIMGTFFSQKSAFKICWVLCNKTKNCWLFFPKLPMLVQVQNLWSSTIQTQNRNKNKPLL